ncbi:MAG TPA: hypothetical protein VFN49_02595 [Candidatus Aquilonibacter sp.]|nr:hypothetical protein [Candidatus Aquilonibacter sp.]
MIRTFARLAIVAVTPMLLAITVTSPGTVTTVVNPNLFTEPSGDQHLHGIVRDPISGDIYVGDWSAISSTTPWFGPYVENRDTIRRINALKEVSVVQYAISPNALAYNPIDKQIYVVVGSVPCMSETQRAPGPTLNGVVAYDPVNGKARVLAGAKPGSENGTQARFSGPVGIATDPASGIVFVSEGCQNRIRVVDMRGSAATLAGTEKPGFADGAHDTAAFDNPRGIAYCDADRALYVADTGNNSIRKVTLNGDVTTLAGDKAAGFVDADAKAARFNAPTGVACDGKGDVYVADSANNAIRKITADGMVTTIAGNGSVGSVDAAGSEARFDHPGDVMYDAAERALYVVDWGTNRVRKVALAQ